MQTLVNVKIKNNKVFLADIYLSEESNTCIHGISVYYNCEKCDEFIKENKHKCKHEETNYYKPIGEEEFRVCKFCSERLPTDRNKIFLSKKKTKIEKIFKGE